MADDDAPQVVIRGDGIKYYEIHPVGWKNDVDHGVQLRFVGGMFICRCGIIGCPEVPTPKQRSK